MEVRRHLRRDGFPGKVAASTSVVAQTDLEPDVNNLSEVGQIFALYPHFEAGF